MLIQNANYHFRFIVTLNSAGETVIRLEQRANGVETFIAEQPISAGRLYLKIEAVGMAYSFAYAMEYERWQMLAEAVDGRILSTSVAQGFTGVYIGMYASSNGLSSENAADFDDFEYIGV